MFIVNFKKNGTQDQNILNLYELIFFLFYCNFNKNYEIVLIRKEEFYE